jgi:hypothetical protein
MTGQLRTGLPSVKRSSRCEFFAYSAVLVAYSSPQAKRPITLDSTPRRNQIKRGKMAEARPYCGSDRFSARFHMHNFDICGGVVSFTGVVCQREYVLAGLASHAKITLRVWPLPLGTGPSRAEPNSC